MPKMSLQAGQMVECIPFHEIGGFMAIDILLDQYKDVKVEYVNCWGGAVSTANTIDEIVFMTF
jgi:hypothetical protein